MHALLDRALAAARQLRASDIHLKAGLAPVLRIDGELRTLSDVPPLSREFLQSLALSMLNDRRREVLERTGDVAMSLVAPDGSRQRVQISQYRGGTAIAVRLVPAHPPTLEKLGLPAGLRALIEPGPGLVLVAGPAGAGKTSTLAALLNELNGARACHVVTVEDPVEILVPDRRSVIVQREVGLDAPSTVAALRAALRQDADVLVVSELRDGETADLAVHAAETGRLVLAGVAAGDATGAAERVVELAGDRGAFRSRLARALRGITAQRLDKRADGRGRAPVLNFRVFDDEARGRLATRAEWDLRPPPSGGAAAAAAPAARDDAADDASERRDGDDDDSPQDVVEDDALPV